MPGTSGEYPRALSTVTIIQSWTLSSDEMSSGTRPTRRLSTLGKLLLAM